MSNDKRTFVGDLDAYNAVRKDGCGVIDLSSRGRIRVSGSEAVMFLNGLITNDMKTLVEGRWMLAAFPNVQGRLIAAVRVIRLQGESNFIIDTEPATHQTVLKNIERFTMAGDFKVKDITDETSTFSVQGKQARRLVEQVVGKTVDDDHGVFETKWNDSELVGLRSSHTSEDGFDLIIEKDLSSKLHDALIAAGAVEVDEDTFETLRIEAGVGVFGKDMDETNVITETNLDDAVSFTKGCYVGQEIIIRIKHRGHVAKKLAGLELEGSEIPNHDSLIKTGEGKEIGRVTSATFSPKLDRVIALGYVRYEYLAPGTEVVVDDRKAVVKELPLVKGSQ